MSKDIRHDRYRFDIECNVFSDIPAIQLINNFKVMYGKEASFINPNNINEVTKTLNNLFLQKDLIS